MNTTATTPEPLALRLASILQAGENFYGESTLWFDSKLAEAAGDAADELRRLVAEVESLRADAERYRWLRDDLDSDWAICEWSSSDSDGIGYYRDARAANVVDAAIDSARKA